MMKSRVFSFLLPILVLIGALLTWFLISYFNLFPAYAFPSPQAVMMSFREEILAGRLINDIIASLWRVAIGFVLSALLGIPLGLWMGQYLFARKSFVPMLNFFRFLSPLAWIPFAILWFHIGDKPAIFLIFMATFFPLALATMVGSCVYPKYLFSRGTRLQLQRHRTVNESDFPCGVTTSHHRIACELWNCLGSYCSCRNGGMPGWTRVWNLGSTQWSPP